MIFIYFKAENLLPNLDNERNCHSLSLGFECHLHCSLYVCMQRMLSEYSSTQNRESDLLFEISINKTELKVRILANSSSLWLVVKFFETVLVPYRLFGWNHSVLNILNKMKDCIYII